MSTTTDLTHVAVPTTAYARHKGARPGFFRRYLALEIALAAVVLGALLVTGSGGFFARWFAKETDASLYHTVAPATLSITLNEDGELKPKNSVEVKCELEGQSTIVFVVPESTRVQKGDPLVELASDEIKDRLDGEEIELQKIRTLFDSAQQDLSITLNENASKIKKAEIDLEVAELELRRYREGDYEKSRKAVEIEIKQTEMDIKQKQDEYTKNEELHKKGFVTKTKLEELAFALEKARMTLEKNKLEQQILEAYERPKNEKQKAAAVDQSREELERERQRSESRQKQAEARVEEQKALLAMKETRYNRLKDQLAKCRIIAPNDGVVQYGGGDQGMFRFGGGNRIAAGEKVFEGQTLMSLPDTSQMIVTTRIHEADRHKVHEGLTCWVRVPAVPDKQFKGTISKIATFADSANRWLNPQLKEHSAEILLDETDAPVSPGDSAEIEIMIEQVPDVLAIPVQSVFSRGDQRFVFARRGISWEPVAVKLGRSNSQLIEVTDGLAAGDRVLMHATDDLLAKLPAIKVDHGAELPPPEVVAGAAREQKVEARTGEAHGAGSAQVRTEGPRQEGARREGGRGSGGRGPGGGGRSGGGPPGGSRGG